MLPTIKSDSIYPLPNDVAIFNINIVDIIFLIGIICLIIKRKSIFNANNDVLDKYNSRSYCSFSIFLLFRIWTNDKLSKKRKLSKRLFE